MCEPCPQGFACTETPFGTFDCLPIRSALAYDGSTVTVDVAVSLDVDAHDTGSEPFMDLDNGAFTADMALDAMDMSPRSALIDGEADTNPRAAEDAFIPADSLPLPQKQGRAAAGRVTRLDIPSTVSDARLSGCTVVGQNAGTGLSGVLTILDTTLSEQFQAGNNGRIPLVLLSDFVNWASGSTSQDYDSGRLEFYAATQTETNEFQIAPSAYVPGVSPPQSRIGFETSFSGSAFSTGEGDFILETSSFGLPFLVELEAASIHGRVDVTDGGVSIVETTLNGYLSFSAIRRIVMAIQRFCNEQPDDLFCTSANRFLDGDPSTAELDGNIDQIARNVILPLMRNMDTRLTDDGPVSCDPFCQAANCVECNAVSVCGLLETVPIVLDE